MTAACEKGTDAAGLVLPGLVRREVWRSMVSMLRVYAHAASLHYGEHRVTETNADVVTLAYGSATLEINFEPEGGMAAWILKRPQGAETAGVFHLSPSGAIQFDGHEKDLDHAAIEWIAELTRAGAENQAGSEG